MIGLAKGVLMGRQGITEEQAQTEILERAKRDGITAGAAAQQTIDSLTGLE